MAFTHEAPGHMRGRGDRDFLIWKACKPSCSDLLHVEAVQAHPPRLLLFIARSSHMSGQEQA